MNGPRLPTTGAAMLASLVLASVVIWNASTAEGQSVSGAASPEELAVFSPIKAKLKTMQARGFVATGLHPVYPVETDCLQGTSEFSSPTRTDGSRRSRKYFRGYHGGHDIPAPEGTPVLAVADGTVVHKTAGKSIGGIGVILQHSQDDTGLPAWIYTEYKHLMKMPELEIGQRVEKGQQIGLNGKTGAIGGHYGTEGFAHLHLTAWYSRGSEFRTGRAFVPIEGRWMDPLALFASHPDLDSHKLRALSAASKNVRIAYMTPDGKVHPETSKIVWPFACVPK